MPLDDFLRSAVESSIDLEDAGLRERALELVRGFMHWETFVRRVCGSHEWDDPLERMVFVRYFAEQQRNQWSEGQPVAREQLIADVASVAARFWAMREGVGEGDETAGDSAQTPEEATNPSGGDSTYFAPGTATPEEAARPRGLWPPQTTLSGIVVFFDSMERLHYARLIEQNATRAVMEINAAATLDDVRTAENIARRVSQDASEYRNARRTASQNRLTPPARQMSKAYQKARGGDRSWRSMMKRKRSAGTLVDTFEAIAKSSGRTDALILNLARAGAVAGTVGSVASSVRSVDRVNEAPEGQRIGVALEETGAMIGGGAGSMLGSALAVGGVGLLLSNPAGWVVVGASLGGALIGGFGGSLAGGEVGRAMASPVEAVVDEAEKGFEAFTGGLLDYGMHRGGWRF